MLVVAAYGLILPQAVLEWPGTGCINIHASLLPRWRGAAPIQRALLAGDAQTGISIMQMDAGLDTGADHRAPRSCRSRRARLPAALTTSSLRSAQRAIVETLAALQRDGRLGGAAATGRRRDLCRQDRPATKPRIDWNATRWRIDRQVRAFNPGPGRVSVAGRAADQDLGVQSPLPGRFGAPGADRPGATARPGRRLRRRRAARARIAARRRQTHDRGSISCRPPACDRNALGRRGIGLNHRRRSQPSKATTNASPISARKRGDERAMFGNWFKTSLLMAAIMALFGMVGAVLGGGQGMLLALLFGLAINLWAYWFSDTMVLKLYNAQRSRRDVRAAALWHRAGNSPRAPDCRCRGSI